MAGNQVSLFGALSVNGFNLIQNPSTFWHDANPTWIGYVKLLVADINGVQTTCFYIAYWNTNSLKYDYYLLPTRTNLMNVTDFKTGLLAINTKNTFSIFTGLAKTTNQALGFFKGKPALQLQVLFNDLYFDDFYSPKALKNAGATIVTLKSPNTLVAEQFWFAGDQNYAGSYDYFTSGGN